MDIYNTFMPPKKSSHCEFINISSKNVQCVSSFLFSSGICCLMVSWFKLAAGN